MDKKIFKINKINNNSNNKILIYKQKTLYHLIHMKAKKTA